MNKIDFVVLVLATLQIINGLPGVGGSAVRNRITTKTAQSGTKTASTTSRVISTCEDNPPAPDRDQDNFSPPEIINAAGFPNETHQATTSDGYILTLHRIRNDGGIPILLMHGILCSSRDWLMQRGNNSLPYQLWIAGYDVWMGNMRGNAYSQGHESIPNPTNNSAYWDFSFDQIAQKDIPMFIDYVLATTNNTELQCVGYSLGTTTIIAGLSRLPEFQKKCKCFTGLAPVTSNGNITSIALKTPGQYTLPEEPLRSFLYGSSPSGVLLPSTIFDMIHQYLPTMCNYDPLGLCLNAAYAVLGAPDPNQVDDDIQPKIYAGFPSPTSIRNFLQVVYTGFYPNREFREYVYQTESQNIEAYGQASSPKYNLSEFHIPTVLFVGPADQVATVLDVKNWSPKLGTKADVNYVDNAAWAHLDFIFAKNACQKLYTPLIQKLQTCSSF